LVGSMRTDQISPGSLIQVVEISMISLSVRDDRPRKRLMDAGVIFSVSLHISSTVCSCLVELASSHSGDIR
jgi:hypothetical protein